MGKRQPLLRVVRGEPTPEEVAALVAVITARMTRDRTAAASAGATPASAWSDRTRLVRTIFPPGPGGWRASAWPR